MASSTKTKQNEKKDFSKTFLYEWLTYFSQQKEKFAWTSYVNCIVFQSLSIFLLGYRIYFYLKYFF